jgi:hypothetical protein
LAEVELASGATEDIIHVVADGAHDLVSFLHGCSCRFGSTCVTAFDTCTSPGECCPVRFMSAYESKSRINRLTIWNGANAHHQRRCAAREPKTLERHCMFAKVKRMTVRNDDKNRRTNKK